jgi:hypothetical protein
VEWLIIDEADKLFEVMKYNALLYMVYNMSHFLSI